MDVSFSCRTFESVAASAARAAAIACSTLRAAVQKRKSFVNFMANTVEWAAPPVEEREEADQEFATASTEARVTPPPQITGTTRGDFSGPVRKDLPVWQLLLWAAVALLALEWLLPAIAFGVAPLWARLRARRRRTRPPPPKEATA